MQYIQTGCAREKYCPTCGLVGQYPIFHYSVSHGSHSIKCAKQDVRATGFRPLVRLLWCGFSFRFYAARRRRNDFWPRFMRPRAVHGFWPAPGGEMGTPPAIGKGHPGCGRSSSVPPVDGRCWRTSRLAKRDERLPLPASCGRIGTKRRRCR
jgi:hypothetical protein